MGFTWGFSLIIAGTLLGTLVGVAQTRVLRAYSPQHEWSSWDLHSFVAGTFVPLFVLALSFLSQSAGLNIIEAGWFMPILASGIFIFVGGIIFGLAQSVVLNDNGLPWKQWAFANGLGVLLGSVVGGTLATLILDYLLGWNWQSGRLFGLVDGIAIAIAGTLSIVVFACITGISIANILHKHPGKRPSS